MDKAQQTKLIKDRAYSLATILLTRRDDLFVTYLQTLEPFDMLVEILKMGQKVGRNFGVELFAFLGDATIANVKTKLQPRLMRFKDRTFTIPVVLFAYSMPSDEAYFTWIAEPVVTEIQGPILRPPDVTVIRALSTKHLNGMIEMVDAWYDAQGYPSQPSLADKKLTGRQVLDLIVDRQAEFLSKKGKPATKMKLPLLLAYDIAKLGRNELGGLSEKILLKGVNVLEQEGLFGLDISIDTAAKDIEME